MTSTRTCFERKHVVRLLSTANVMSYGWATLEAIVTARKPALTEKRSKTGKELHDYVTIS